MSGETVITVIGNLTADPELRFTPSGSPVANFTIASTPRTFDRELNDWKDGEALFLRCSVWRETAENVAESLRKGLRVIAQGRLRARSYDTKEGERRTVMELEVDEIGPSMRYCSAKVVRNDRQGFSSGNNAGGSGWNNQQAPQQQSAPPPQQQGWNNQQSPAQQPPSPAQGGGYNQPPLQQGGAPQQGGGNNDPWATGGNNGGWGQQRGDEPPF